MAKDIGIDLGTADVLVNVSGKGIILNEPSVVAVNTENNEVVAVGTEAYEMVGRTPGNIRVIHPLKNGVIADFDITEAMLSYFIEKLNVKGFMAKPNILTCAPTGVASIKQKAIVQATEESGGGRVYLDFEPKVAAVGAGLDIFKPQGNMVIDTGDGTTDIAVLSMGEIATAKSLRWTGDKMNQATVSYIRNDRNLSIGSRIAEQIKIEIGSAFESDPEKKITVRGRDMVVGLPKQTVISTVEAQEPLHDGLMSVVRATKEVLEQTPPEPSVDITDRGTMLTGGGALLVNLDKLIAYYLQVPVLTADSPLGAVALGIGTLLKNTEKHQGRQEKILSELLIFLVRAYQKFISPILPPTCRHYPTYSSYMIDNLRKHGPLKGLIMGIARTVRCNPFIRGGVDLVPNHFILRRNPHPEKYKDPIIAKKFHSK